MPEKKEPGSKGNIPQLAQLASDVHIALTKGGGLPDSVSTLSPKQYADLLDAVAKRVSLSIKSGPISFRQELAVRLLSPEQHKPKANSIADAYGSAIALARLISSDGDLAVSLLNRALHAMPPSGPEVLKFFRRIGPDWEIAAALAESWEKSEVPARPESAATSALARLLASYLGGTSSKAAPGSGFSVQAMRSLVTSLAGVRPRDLGGTTDPLLMAVRSAIERQSVEIDRLDLSDEGGTTNQRRNRNIERPKDDEVEVLSGRTALLRVSELLGIVGKEIDRAIELEKRLANLSAELKRMTGERDDALGAASTQNATNVMLRETLAAREAALHEVREELSVARADVNAWKSECGRVENHAKAVARHEVAVIQTELKNILDRYGKPALEIAGLARTAPESVVRLTVNLSNLIQKIERLAGARQERGRSDIVEADTGMERGEQ